MNPHNREYHLLLERILDHGYDTGDRTGTGTRSLFGEQMKFDLQKGFPLLTTKKVFTKAIIHELLWFIAGDTNIKYLQDNGVHIWDQWADEKGDLGPVYGKQWRAFGNTDMLIREEDDSLTFVGELQGIDQLSDVIERIKTNPTCRRLIVSAWNPQALGAMALPPCHCLFQFKVYGDTLNLQLYQRSCDVFLGIPFNIASYALLLAMVAQVTGLKAGIFTHTLGDVHIYTNHVDQVNEQLSRDMCKHPPPTLSLNPDVMNIEEFTYDDIEIHDYKSFGVIKAEVSV